MHGNIRGGGGNPIWGSGGKKKQGWAGDSIPFDFLGLFQVGKGGCGENFHGGVNNTLSSGGLANLGKNRRWGGSGAKKRRGLRKEGGLQLDHVMKLGS